MRCDTGQQHTTTNTTTTTATTTIVVREDHGTAFSHSPSSIIPCDHSSSPSHLPCTSQTIPSLGFDSPRPTQDAIWRRGGWIGLGWVVLDWPVRDRRVPYRALVYY